MNTKRNLVLTPLEEEIKQATKDFKIFIRITNRVHRYFKRAHKQCKKIYAKELKYSVDGANVFGSQSAFDDAWERMVA